MGAVLLTLAWQASPPPVPPMYEGLPGPAEPYRYLHPPPGLGSTPRPSSAHVTAPLREGQSPALSPATAEMPPQAQLLAAQGAFVVPPGVTGVEATIAPVDPPPVAPIGGEVAGNVYRIVVTAAGTPLAVRPGRTVTVVLRGPAGFGGPIVERFAAGTWTRLDTQPLGALAGDSYAADAAGLGDVALVAAPGPSPGGGGDAVIVVLAAGAVLLLGGTLLALRRSGRPPAAGRPGRRPAPSGPRRRR
ncbi:MAG: hypothetical protein QOG45_2824 [Chloroflexota bacterium]|nr:hypothetical protein [Chloroflexota bacterium]